MTEPGEFHISEDGVFVRAMAGKFWVNASPLDLDDESFRRLVMRKLAEVGILVSMKQEGARIPLVVRQDRVDDLVRKKFEDE